MWLSFIICHMCMTFIWQIDPSAPFSESNLTHSHIPTHGKQGFPNHQSNPLVDHFLSKGWTCLIFTTITGLAITLCARIWLCQSCRSIHFLWRYLKRYGGLEKPRLPRSYRTPWFLKASGRLGSLVSTRWIRVTTGKPFVNDVFLGWWIISVWSNGEDLNSENTWVLVYCTSWRPWKGLWILFLCQNQTPQKGLF